MKQTKEQAKQSWMRFFEELVTKDKPELKGKIDWNTAHHFMYIGLTTKEASERYLKSVEAKNE